MVLQWHPDCFERLKNGKKGEVHGLRHCSTILQVYKALWQKQTIVAVKVMREQTDKAQQAFLKEIEVLCSLRHPNVVSFYGAYAQVRHLGKLTSLSGGLRCFVTSATLTWCQLCTDEHLCWATSVHEQ